MSIEEQDSMSYGMKAQREASSCKICGRLLLKNGKSEGYFKLNTETDRFDLLCEGCWCES